MGVAGRAPAHGGMGAVAGLTPAAPQINAQLHRSLGVVRVWQGIAGPREEFTVDEARLLCRRGDQALSSQTGRPSRFVEMMIDDEFDPFFRAIVNHDWLVAFLSALRRALRPLDAATAGEPSSCIDAESDPGSWARHLRHMEAMQ